MSIEQENASGYTGIRHATTEERILVTENKKLQSSEGFVINDLNKQDTGWRQLKYLDNANRTGKLCLVTSDGKFAKDFKNPDMASGSAQIRMYAQAHEFAIDFACVATTKEYVPLLKTEYDYGMPKQKSNSQRNAPEDIDTLSLKELTKSTNLKVALPLTSAVPLGIKERQSNAQILISDSKVKSIFDMLDEIKVASSKNIEALSYEDDDSLRHNVDTLNQLLVQFDHELRSVLVASVDKSNLLTNELPVKKEIER